MPGDPKECRQHAPCMRAPNYIEFTRRQKDQKVEFTHGNKPGAEGSMNLSRVVHMRGSLLGSDSLRGSPGAGARARKGYAFLARLLLTSLSSSDVLS